MDLCLGAAALVLLSPLLVLVALIVRLDSAGPSIFRQTRIGMGRRPFAMWKFRTMVRDAPDDLHRDLVLALVRDAEPPRSVYKLADDPRITRVGRWLRKTSLDELPQLVNVVRGDMSLVGPRPCLPSQGDVIAARRRRNVFSIRPGITGLAQLASIDMSTPEKLAEVDSRYMHGRSFLGDLRIIAATMLGGGAGDALKS
jgi:O-antigen biosynthesis protein WbqP